MISDNQLGMKDFTTGDETWTYGYEPETTDQSREYRWTVGVMTEKTAHVKLSLIIVVLRVVNFSRRPQPLTSNIICVWEIL